jgi:cysteine desulfurase
MKEAKMLIYLDNSATTKQYDTVTEVMTRLMNEDYGNPSALHRMGMNAERAVKEARAAVAATLSAKPEEIFFTGSGTESDNTAIIGAALARKRKGNRILTTKIEHPAVMESCKRLESMGFVVDRIGVDSKGLVDMNEFEEKLDDSVILVSVMAVNNELGTVEPIPEIGRLIRQKSEALFHSDAVQAFGKIILAPEAENIDLLSVSGHKIHGPKGTGALYIKKGIHIEPYLLGGGQEHGFRSGTENTPALAGFGLAAKIMSTDFEDRIRKMAKARNYLMEGLKAEIADIIINSPERTAEGRFACLETVCCPSILNVSFSGCRGEVLLHSLEQQDIYVSTGAACSSKKKGSHVLAATGLAAPLIEGAIRFSFSEFNTTGEMDYVLCELKKSVASMRKLLHYR